MKRSSALLITVAFVAVGLPILFGQVNQTLDRAQLQATVAPVYEYEVVSIKPNKSHRGGVIEAPNGWTATGVPPFLSILEGYGINFEQISGAPNWLFSEPYDIDAKMNSSVADALNKLSPDERKLMRRRMLQALLADRFKLIVHRETKELPAYVLSLGKSGSNLQEAKPGDTYADGLKGPNGLPLGPHACRSDPGRGTLTLQADPISCLTEGLSKMMGHSVTRIVVDKTGLTGSYDITLQFWTPGDMQALASDMETVRSKVADGSLSMAGAEEMGKERINDVMVQILKTFEKQTGLKVELQKAPVEIIVIDHVERPSEN